jgi:hypothetical protein
MSGNRDFKDAGFNQRGNNRIRQSLSGTQGIDNLTNIDPKIEY